MADKNNLKLLFYRPQEPIFVQKGPSGAVFDVPDNFLTDRYRPIGPDLQNRYNISRLILFNYKPSYIIDLESLQCKGFRLKI